MKNRIASLFLVFALLMSLCNFAVARDNRITVQSGGAERFTDVPADHWAYAYINKVVGSGLFNGKTETTFEPSNAMTRSQFVLVMDRMEGMKSLEGVPTQTIFPDVAPTRLAAGPIQWANEQGFVRGFGDGTFKPDSPITRGQFAALIHRYIIAKRYTNLHVVDPIPAQFTDAGSVSSAFTEDVEYARVHGLLTGYSDGTVRASNPITRAAIAAILARFLDLVTESGYTPLLDGPVDGGTTVDSGDSIEEPPVEVPTEYDGIRLNITNAKRGTTSFVSVLRDGVQVASDDVQPGDVVKLSHVPQDGYRVKITVKDSKGRAVDVTTNGNVSTFVVPQNMPVTITLKYLSSGSGGSSGGSGGGSSSGGGGSSGGYSPIGPVTNNYYYMYAVAVRAAASNAEGSVWLSKDPLTAENIATAPRAQSIDWNNVTNHGASFTFYAVLEAAASVNKNCTVSIGETVLPDTVITNRDTSIAGYTVLTITVNSTGTTANTATVVTVTATFTQGGDGPDIPPTARTWTVNVTGSDEFAFYSLVDAAPTDATALTANGTASIQKAVTNGTAADVYLIVTPKPGFKFGDNVITFNPADGSTATLVSPTVGSATETDTVRVYRITRSSFPSNATTNVSINMQLLNGAGRTHAVTVQSLLWNGSATVAMPDNVPLAASVDLSPATYLNTVTVNVPFLTGYRGYHLRGITVVDADNAAVTYTKDSANSSETGDVYTFVMPDRAVNVTVVYEANANANLNFDVAVNISGQGTVSLNIAGVTQTIDSANVTSFPVHRYVRLGDDGAVIVTEDNTAGSPMTQADYVELYGNENFTLPVYLTAAPIAAKNYKFQSASYNGTAVSAENISAEQAVRNATPMNLSVSFSQITSYGYNLTIIGKGTVNNTFDNVARTNASGLPETYSSGLVVTNTNSLTVTAAPTVASGKSASDYEVTINGQVSDSATINLTQGELTDIIVEIQDKDRNAVEFTVQVTGGSVRVKPESGRIMLTSGYTAETAKEQLKSTTGTMAGDTVSNQTKSYFAFENSVITIIPTTTNATKVTQIKVTKTPGGAASDVLNTSGFSFQLTSPQASAVVTFGTFDSYSVLFQAPYNGGNGPSMRSLSTNIAKTYDATVQEVLYSLNDGQRIDPATNTRTGITNEFSAPATMNQTLAYYLSHRVVEDENGAKITGADSVKNMLEDSIKSSIATVFPSVVEAKKADLKSDPANVTGPIGTEMRSRQANASSMEVTGAAKSTVLENTSYYQQLLDGTVQESSFRVMANVTTILSLEKENELKTRYPALASELTGKSAEAQLSGFVSDYLGKIQVQPNYNYSNLTPAFTVTPNATNSTMPTLTISANVTAAGNNWPQLDNSVSMTQYADRFNIWILAEISQVLYDSNGDGTFDAATEAVQMTNAAPALYNAAQLGVTVDKTAMLRNIDNAVNTTWNNSFGGNGVAIDMTQVLSGELIGSVVKEVIQGPSDTLTSRVSSLGDGANTRAAFMNLYDGFVECNSKDPQNMLTLKTKGGTSTVIGRATNNNQNLVLTIDFTQILRDTATPTDQTSYEVLVDLLVGLRNGISTDIRETSEASNNNQSAQSVIASLIESQLNGGNRNAVTVNKWGTEKRGSQMTAAERKEVANLLAGMVMNSEMSDAFNTAWKGFEDSGYQSVTFSFTLDASKRSRLAPILESYYGNTDTKTLNIGFNVTQVIS